MKFSTTFTVTVLYLCLVAVNTSCRGKNAQQPNDLFYYPAKNVYYDSQQAMFYYSLNGAGSWDSVPAGQSLPAGILGERVPIQRTGENVWAANEDDRKKYNGTLINIVNDATLSLTRADSMRRVKAIIAAKPKQDEPVVEKEEPPKKGLKKFFNKLFGKKKKPESEEKKQ